MKGLFLAGMVFMTMSWIQAQGMDHLDTLRESRTFPEAIMTEPTAVVVNLSYEKYKPYSLIIHQGLRRAGIDAVMYLYYTDLFAGIDVTPSFIEDMVARNISNIVYVNEFEGGLFRVVISSFTGDSRIIDPTAQNWTIRGRDFDYLFTSVYRETANSGLERTNNMIIDTPEYFTDTNLIRGTRRQSPFLNLKLDKLAVPYFKGKGSEEMNARLQQLFRDYPHPVEFVDPDADPMQLRKELNCQVILRFLHTNQKSAMKMLDYPQVINSDKIVYKFYLKHIFTGNIFLGTKWDASASWEKALVDYFEEL